MKRGKPALVRNWQKLNTERIKNAKLPIHSQFKLKNKNKFEEFIDPYKYLENPTKQQAESFENKEMIYAQSLGMKHEMLEAVFIREIENRPHNPQLVPIHSGKHLYYRNINNIADNLTIYRYPASQIPPKERGKIPTKNLSENEEKIFSLKDITVLYDEYALRIKAVKEFTETLMETMELGRVNPLYWFTTNKEENYAAIIFDTYGEGEDYDIIVKDLILDKLMPIIVRNSNGIGKQRLRILLIILKFLAIKYNLFDINV